MMGDSVADILICAGESVLEGGKGVRFPVEAGGDKATGFVVRYDGKAYAYLNRCAHVPRAGLGRGGVLRVERLVPDVLDARRHLCAGERLSRRRALPGRPAAAYPRCRARRPDLLAARRLCQTRARLRR